MRIEQRKLLIDHERLQWIYAQVFRSLNQQRNESGFRYKITKNQIVLR